MTAAEITKIDEGKAAALNLRPYNPQPGENSILFRLGSVENIARHLVYVLEKDFSIKPKISQKFWKFTFTEEAKK